MEEKRELLKQYGLDPDEFISDSTPSKVYQILLIALSLNEHYAFSILLIIDLNWTRILVEKE